MPFCPICGDEYEAGYERCADCGARLVESLEPDPAPGELTEVVRFQDRKTTTAAEEWLHRHQIPSVTEIIPPDSAQVSLMRQAPTEAFRVLVPAPLWQAAVELMTQLLQGLAEGGEPEEPKLPEGLSRSLAEIMAEGPGVLADLAEAVLVGDRQMQVKAAYALVRMGEPARQLLMGLLSDAIGEDDEDRIRRVAKVLAEMHDPEPVRAVTQMLSDPARRRAVIAALGYLGDSQAAPVLVALLEDADPEVRDEAAEGLYNLTEETFDFRAEDPPEKRVQAVELWHHWLVHRRLS